MLKFTQRNFYQSKHFSILWEHISKTIIPKLNSKHKLLFLHVFNNRANKTKSQG